MPSKRNQRTQLTVPERKTYAWERYVALTYGKARQLTRFFHALQPDLHNALDELKFQGKRLTGPRLKQVVVALAREKNWRSNKRTTTFINHYTPFQPGKRVVSTDAGVQRICIKCGVTKPEADYITEMTASQAKRWGYARPEVVQGFTDMYGKFHRGHFITRRIRGAPPTIGNVCAACRNEPSERKPNHKTYSPTQTALLQQISSAMRGTSTHIALTPRLKLRPEQVKTRMDFLGRKRALLHHAKYLIQQASRDKKRGPAPTLWQELLTPEHRAELEQLYQNVFWSRRKGALWE